jgi:glutamyl-tRNA reductase
MIDPGPGIAALLTHARTVPSEERERFAAAASALADDPRAMVLRTCHRVEVYVATDALDPLVLPELPPGGRRLDGHAAARHLFTVAAGLDSIVVGEDQVLHQLRGCLSERHEAGFDCPVRPEEALRDAAHATLHPVLERLFQIALHVGRQTRAWREGPPRSLSDVALDRIEAATGPLDGTRLLIVGAGRMGRLAALGAARRGARALVANRTFERAQALASDADGIAIGYGPAEPLPDVRGIVLAVAGRWDLGEPAARMLAAGDSTIVDLSSPPALETGLRGALGARYVSVDDLARGPQGDVRARFRRRVERLVDEADAELAHWVAARTAVPAIQALTERAETRRATEVERLLRRMPALEEHERELVDQMSRRLVAALLHAPLSTLRDDESGDRERAARELFAL